jgi:imidazolonepropionase
MSYTIVHDASQVVTGPAENGSDGRATVTTESDAAVVIEEGTVTAVGPTAELTDAYPPADAATAIDATGRCVLPGFVDSHTHAMFVGDRSDEFAAKLRGKSYQEILADGGGILRTVRMVRDARRAELADRLRTHLDMLVANGTTTVEIKSGYGLDTETELEMLSVIDQVGSSHPVDVVPTFMGAHAIPENEDAETYTETVITEQLPAVEDQGIARFCDVFCEADVFSAEQSMRILQAGQEHGLAAKIHADEFTRLGGSQVAADLSATSADHLLQATDEDAAALVENGVTPVFLPGTAFGLDGEYPDPAPFLERGVVPAVATDFNPNCFAPTLSFAATLGCVGAGMTPAEAVLGITARGAAAIGAENGCGRIHPGSPGDLVVLDAPAYRHLPYRYDVSGVDTVLKGGTVVA